MQNKIQITISFLFQLSLLVASLLIWNHFHVKNDTNQSVFAESLAVLLIAWIIAAWFTHKYKPQYYQRKWIYVIAPFFKAAVLFLFLIVIISFTFLNLDYQNWLLYKVALIYLTIELVIYSTIIHFNNLKSNGAKFKVKESKKYIQEDLTFNKINEFNINFEVTNFNSELFSKEIIFELFTEQQNESALCSKINVICSKRNSSSSNSLNLISILDIRINDLKDINQEVKSMYNSIIPGGYLFASYKNIDDFETEYFGSSAGFIVFFKKIIYYFYYRAFPKIPYLNILYKILSGGKNKVLSKAETWGRLFYAGFDVEKEIKHDGICYLVARKSKTPSENPNPSFYPIITLNRVSMFGNIVKIHKIRSMYPYSEFLQKKVFEQNELTSTGKFAADFRITEFGKIYRKYWIDEIPQLLDWFRGTIKLVGIRAMSQHFFSLYPKEYQEMYFKVKPGIISPIFDEKTDGFKDIVKIEQEYLENFLKHPIKTDIKYFFLTIRHMVAGVRSK